MNITNHRSITNILSNPKHRLTSLIQKVQNLSKLNQLLQNTVEKSLKNHCQLANYENGQLIVIATNSAWATRIRFAIPDLLEALQQTPAFNRLKKIHCIIQLKDPEQPTKPLKKFQLNLSSDSVQIIKTTAKNMENKELKAALLRLANSMENITQTDPSE